MKQRNIDTRFIREHSQVGLLSSVDFSLETIGKISRFQKCIHSAITHDIDTCYSTYLCLLSGEPPWLEIWQGPSCTELILRYTILGGSHARFPNVGIRSGTVQPVGWLRQCFFLIYSKMVRPHERGITADFLGDFPSENHRGNPPGFSLSCGRTISLIVTTI